MRISSQSTEGKYENFVDFQAGASTRPVSERNLEAVSFMDEQRNYRRPDTPREDLIDLRYYFLLLKKNKWNILASALVVAVAVYVITSSLQPIYQSSTTVMIESNPSNVVSIEDVYAVNSKNKEYFLTQFEIFKSRELTYRVAKRLDLAVHPLFDPRQQTPNVIVSQYIDPALGYVSRLLHISEDAEQQQPSQRFSDSDALRIATDRLRGMVEIMPIDNTQLVTVVVEATEPGLAADIADAYADVYIESHMEARLATTKKATDWLSGRLVDLRENLQLSEQRLQAYREESELVDVGGVQTFGAEQLQLLTTRYIDAQNRRSEAQTLLRQIQALGSPSPEQLMSIPSILRHPLVQSLKQAQAQADRRVAELSKRYGPKHPAMVSALSEAKEARDELYRQITRVRDSIATDYRAARDNEQTLEAKVTAAKQGMQQVNRKEFRLQELEREVATNRQLYEMFMSRAKETDESAGIQTPLATVVDPAVVPRIPVKPQVKVLTVLAFAGSLAFGVLVVLVLDSFNNTIRLPEELEDKLHISLLGYLPAVKNRKNKNAFEGFISQANSQFAESIRTIRTSLMMSNLNKPSKITLITSSVPNEGKSTVALNLAAAIGQMEKVLLVDADLRRPSVANSIGIPRSTRGLGNIVTDSADIKDCIFSHTELGIDVLTAGSIPYNPLEMISSKKFSETLSRLSRLYDSIIIDSAPMHVVSDAMVISKLADVVIYVVKAEETPVPIAARSIKRLSDSGAPLVGAVLNNLDLSKLTSAEGHYGDYYTNYEYMKAGYEKA